MLLVLGCIIGFPAQGGAQGEKFAGSPALVLVPLPADARESLRESDAAPAQRRLPTAPWVWCLVAMLRSMAALMPVMRSMMMPVTMVESAIMPAGAGRAQLPLALAFASSFALACLISASARLVRTGHSQLYSRSYSRRCCQS